jgi:hypothetical protein
MAEVVYQKFVREAQKKIKEIGLTYGVDTVYENIGLAGGIQKHKNRPISRVVILPVDTEDVKTSNILLEISTSPKTWRYRLPSLWEGKVEENSWHPLDVSESEREELKSSLLRNIERLEQGLATMKK